MKYYVLKDGRILTDISLIGEEEYVELDSYPYPEYVNDKIKVVTGVKDGELVYTYMDIPVPEPEPEPQPTQLDRIEALAVAGNDIEEKTLGEVTNLGESNLIIMEAIATQYEEGLENDLNNKEVLATIYEELLAQKEVK